MVIDRHMERGLGTWRIGIAALSVTGGDVLPGAVVVSESLYESKSEICFHCLLGEVTGMEMKNSDWLLNGK